MPENILRERLPSGITAGWNLETLRAKLDKDIIASLAWMKVEKLKCGSQMRRVGFGGVQEWKTELRHIGITHHLYALSVYCESEKDEATLRALADAKRAKYTSANLPLPVGGVELGQIEIGAHIIDGGHRTKSLLELQNEATDEKEREKYVWVPVRVYSRKVKPELTLLSKLINDKSSKGVQEDNLERLTFVQGVYREFVEHVWGPEQSNPRNRRSQTKGKQHPNEPTVAQVLEYYKKVSGLLTVGYARQIVRSALNVLGKPTEHLTTLLNDAEKRNDKVQHVCLDIPSVFFFVSFRCLIGK